MKKLRSINDLAINGGSPAFANPIHVGRPIIPDKSALVNRFSQILENQWLTNNGPTVEELEHRIAEYLGVQHCIAMCNGTIALEVAIRALGLAGEVIVPSWTFIATAHSLYWQGIQPVFADIDPKTHNLDPEAVERLITPRTTGIIGVHLWGRPAPIHDLQSIADRHGLHLIYDSAHAFGNTFKGVRLGNFGACEVFSFHATKAFNTMEGGAVTTNNKRLADTIRLMRNFGFNGYDNVTHPGTNGKMTEVCAATGLTNLESISEIFSTNRKNHSKYKKHINDINGIKILDYNDHEINNYHYIVIELEDHLSKLRDKIVNILHAENVLARKYFWPGCHRMQPYKDLYPESGAMLPHTENLSSRIIVLPNGPEINNQDIEQISTILELATQ